MTVNDIVKKIYEEPDRVRAEHRQDFVRNIVQRTLELAIGNLADDLVAARREHNASWTAVTVWMQGAKASGELTRIRIRQAPEWIAFERAESAWAAALAKLDAWIASEAKP